jgi:hypothetical protein
MEATDRERCLELLRRLAERAIANAVAQKAAGMFRPTLTTVDRFTATKLDYCPERGMIGKSGSNSLGLREGWIHAGMMTASSLGREPEWLELVEKGVESTRLHGHFMHQVLPTLRDEPLNVEEWERRRAALLEPRKKKSFASYPELQVVGLVIQDEPFSIQFDKWRFTFRRPVVADYCYERAVGMNLGAGVNEEFVDAYVKVEGESEHDDSEEAESELMDIAGWANAIMRLAMPSGVAITGLVSKYFENPAMVAGVHLTGDDGHKHPPARVGAANVARFTGLCELLAKHIPRNMVDENQTKVDHFAISYHRYADAISISGLTERRIAMAVMGIESLFMTDKDVIGYKLSIRLPKLLVLVGVNPVETKKLVADAYTIRSKYVHGDSLTGKEYKKMVKEYGNVEAMLDKLIPLLRLALIICLCGLRDKDERVKLIDNALIDPTKQDELSKAVAPVVPYLTV